MPHDVQGGSLDLIRSYIALDRKQEAQLLIDKLWLKSGQYLHWYCSLDGQRFDSSHRECMIHFYVLEQLLDMQESLSIEETDKKEKMLQSLLTIYQAKGGADE